MSCVAEHARARRRRLGLRRRARGAAVDRHPAVRLARGHEPQRRRPAAWPSSTRTTASMPCSRSSTSTATATSTRRSSPTRTAPRRRSSRRCASAACASSTCRRTSACATATPTSSGTASTARPSSSAPASTACPRSTATRSPLADLVANPGCYPTATLLALAPLARSGTIVDVVVDAKSGVSGAGRAATSKTHFVTVDENVAPYGVGAHRHMPEIDQELAALGAPVTTTFTPHLLPLDQGELVSCYVTTSEPWSQDRVDEAYGELGRRQAVRRGRRRRRRACATCATRTSARSTRAPTRAPARCFVFARDRQPLEGRGVAGRAEPQPHVRPARDAGDRAVSFFASRWVPRPEHVARRRRRRPAGGLSRRRRRGGRSRREGVLDVGLLVCDAPNAVSAARFTRSGVLAAPVLVTRDHARMDALRVVAANSGNANAATGAPRHGGRARDAARGGRRRRRRRRPGRGRLDRRDRRPARRRSSSPTACAQAASALHAGGDVDFSEAIMTTDAFAKRASLDVTLPSGDGAPQRAGQGRGDDRAGVRDDAVLRADRRGAASPRPPTCCSASASSARSIASPSTGSCRRTTP